MKQKLNERYKIVDIETIPHETKEIINVDLVATMCAMDVIKAGVLFGNNLPAIKRYIKENNELNLLGDKSGIKIIDFKPFQFDEMRLELEDVEIRKEK